MYRYSVHIVLKIYCSSKQFSVVLDEPTIRAASWQTCYTQTRMLSVINQIKLW